MKYLKVDMRMEFAVIFAVLGLAAMSIVTPHHQALAPSSGTFGSDAVSEMAVKTLVQDFGTKLQMVSVMAPKALAAKAIRENYTALVFPDLLAAWVTNPAKAPGRLTSSPWPDHIDLLSLTLMTTGIYAVKGNVVEVASDGQDISLQGGVANTYPVSLTVANQDGKWLIADYADGLRR